MKESLIKDYFDTLCEGYKRQDRLAGREIVEEEYITGDWFMSKTKVNSCCSNCGDVSVSFDHGAIRSNITAQRNDNSICHTVDNCILMCCTCNVSIKMTFFYIGYMEAKFNKVEVKDEIIDKVYKDPAGYGSMAFTLKQAKKKNPKFTMEDVKRWYAVNA